MSLILGDGRQRIFSNRITIAGPTSAAAFETRRLSLVAFDASGPTIAMKSQHSGQGGYMFKDTRGSRNLKTTPGQESSVNFEI